MLKNLFIMLFSVASISVSQAEMNLNGAGASFPAPVYQAWTFDYSSKNPDTKINYQSLGSGAGINQIKAGTVDFAGTDNPLSQQEQNEASLIQFPMLTGGVVVIVNLPGVASGVLKLDQQTLSNIYLGKVTRWDDAAIKALNPDLKLPNLKITVVRRSDSSGTTFIFTDYLSKISAEWKEKVGAGPSVKWPVGLGGQKNPGVCNNVAKIKGSIGYTEYTYAVESKLNCVTLKNREGVFVAPSVETFSASASNADWKNAPGFCMALTDTPGEKSWPITGVTYILLRKDLAADKKAALTRYFNWCFTDGAAKATQLNYVSLPESVVELINAGPLK